MTTRKSNKYNSKVSVENITSFAIKARPFVKWVGGKRQLLRQFEALLPNNFNPNKNTYFEPFLGGGAVFFDLQPFNAVLSDINSELISTYQVIRDNVEDLISSLKKHRYKKEYYLKIRELEPSKLSKIEVASRFIYLNRTCFNGMHRVNKKGKFNVPFGRYSKPKICDEENLRNANKVLQGVDIKLQKYENVLDLAKKGDFIYLDPPYYPLSKTSNFTSYNADCFLEKEQEKLRDVFLELDKKGCFVMLSNSDTDFIREIYSEKSEKIRIVPVQAGRSINSNASRRGKISELVILNY